VENSEAYRKEACTNPLRPSANEGRVVIPKSLRDHFGLRDGTELEVEATSEGIRLRPHHSRPIFLEKEGVLVHHGREVASDLDIARVINRQREIRALQTLPPTP
jgi:AbrB family looped-hinge helix DNA binding protein